MTDLTLPLGDAQVALPADCAARAQVAPLHPTPPAQLSDTQAAVGRWLEQTLAQARTALEQRLAAKPGKKTGPRAYARVMLLVADDTRRVGYDPWIAELADGLVAAGVEENRVEFFVVGQLDDPPLGLRLIRHLGEDACGRFAAESHRADRESDHDPERDGLDAAFLRERTLAIAARPVFEIPHWTNTLETFLGRGLLARPLCEIVQHAAVTEYLQAAARRPPPTSETVLPALLAHEAAGFAPLLQPWRAAVIDAPFLVDNRGEALSAHTRPGAQNPVPAAAVATAVGATPTDLWFDNLLTAAAQGAGQLQPGGRLLVAGAADEGLPFPAWREVLDTLQQTPRENSWAAAVAAAERLAESAPTLRYAILQLGAVLQTASTVTFVSPGLLPAEDDDESERPRREIPAGPRMCATPDWPAAQPPAGLRILIP